MKSGDIARELGISEELVAKYALAAGLLPCKRLQKRKVTPQDLVYMRDMFLDGATIREIAEYFGLHPRTVLDYLYGMGLKRRKRRRVKITREELEALCCRGLTDRAIAERYGVSAQYITQLRHRYGIYKEGPRGMRRRRYLERLADAVMEEIEVKCYTTNRELRERGFSISRRRLRELEDFIEGLQWFQIKETSTPKYTVLPASFSGMIIIYVEGCEEEVLKFLIRNLKCTNPSSLRQLLKSWGAPEELLKYRFIG